MWFNNGCGSFRSQDLSLDLSLPVIAVRGRDRYPLWGLEETYYRIRSPHRGYAVAPRRI